MSDKNSKMNSFYEQLTNIEDKEFFEYVYLDEYEKDKDRLKEIFKETILITRNNKNELLMHEPNTNNEKTKLSYIPEVDLMILKDQDNLPFKILDKMLSEHTIICKVFDDIFYLEDCLKKERRIVTEHDSLKVIDDGIHTKIIRDIDDE